jgi:hypothetical protein
MLKLFYTAVHHTFCRHVVQHVHSYAHGPLLCVPALCFLLKNTDLVCDVANAGQILIDEATFLLVKDSLSALGTVNEGGYDDQMLQELMQSQAIGKLQQQVACGACTRCDSKQLSVQYVH